MDVRVSAAEILQAGLTIEPEEAIAIAQQLIATFRTGTCAEVVEPPFGPPAPERVVLHDDGTVVCRGCETTPAVSEIAMLLETLLPPPPSRVPGGLRYTIARAMLDVDVAPFDSLDELSETLERYERGPRDRIVIGLLRRFAASRGLVTASAAERRRDVRATGLRRALREADARLYMQRVALQAVTVSPAPARSPSLPAALLGVAAGALLMITGEVMYHYSHGDTVSSPAAVTAPPVAPPERVAPLANAATPAVTRTAAVDDASADGRAAPVHVRAVQSTPRPVAATTKAAAAPAKTAKRPSHPRPRVYPEPAPRGSHGVFDRLRLRWLRDVFTKADL